MKKRIQGELPQYWLILETKEKILSISEIKTYNKWHATHIDTFYKLVALSAAQMKNNSSIGMLVAGSFRVSLFIDLGCPGDFGKGWRGDLGTFMISRPI